MNNEPRHSRLRRVLRAFDTIFVVTVLVPTLAAVVYYGLIASDVYISESRFLVRSPERQVQSGLGSLLQSTGFSRSQDDTYSVQDFVLSRDAVRQLDARMNVRAAFSDPSVDVFNRFGSVGRDRSFESFYEYYQKHVIVDYDTTSSISELRVYAYKAEDAKRINELLLEMGEYLINTLNERSRQDLIAVARQEVTAAENRALAAATAVSSYRANRSVFDPVGQSALQMQSVTKLEQDRIAAEAALAEVKRVSPQNPQVTSLTQRVQGLREAIAAESARVTSGNSASLSSKAPAYDQLVLEKTFADRQLGTALSSLESARSEAARKQLYLERLVQPNLPDKAMEPHRIRSILTVLLLGLVAWAVGSLVTASVREHTE